MNKKVDTLGISPQNASQRFGPPAASTSVRDTLTILVADTKIMSICCNGLTDLLKFEVP
jgi:hypothetical protein